MEWVSTFGRENTGAYGRFMENGYRSGVSGSVKKENRI